MKRVMKCSIMIMAIALMFTFGYSQAVSAKSSNGKKVTYTLKKGTLTIQGKGKMPKSMKFKKNKKIKKVVIKKGITSIPELAFWNCKNLKKVQIANTVKRLGFQCFGGTGIKSITIPSSVKTIETGIFYYCKSITKVTMPGDFKLINNGDGDENPRVFYLANGGTVNFNSPLKLENLTYVPAKNWNVWKKDKKYKSIAGVIYSKNGKNIVRVPSKRTNLNIAEGCTTFSLSSIFYGFDEVEEGAMSQCTSLENITIPKTVTKIEDTKYRTGVFCENDVPLKKIQINSKALDTKSILLLTKYIKNDYSSYLEIEDLGKMFPDRIKNVNGCYIMDGTILIGYQGTGTEIKVPQGVTTITGNILCVHNLTEGMKEVKRKIVLPDSVKTIEEKAFYDIAIEEIALPKGLETIGDYAFQFANIKKIEIPDNVKKLGKYVFMQTELEEAVLPDNMSIIPEGMFYECQKLKKINIPTKLKTIKKDAFVDTKVNVQVILNKETLEYIGQEAFAGIEWQNLTIPEHIKTIKKRAFSGFGKGKRIVTVKGNTANYAGTAFADYEYLDNKNYVELKFEKGIKQSFVPLFNSMTSYEPKKKTTTVKVTWIGVQDVDGYYMEVSYDKNFKKVLKKATVSKKSKNKTMKVSYKNKKIYTRIRPYKMVNKKRVYGKWTVARN